MQRGEGSMAKRVRWMLMGWEGGPLSRGQNAAKLCSSRHDAAGDG